jgi:hypothetical protein
VEDCYKTNLSVYKCLEFFYDEINKSWATNHQTNHGQRTETILRKSSPN